MQIKYISMYQEKLDVMPLHPACLIKLGIAERLYRGDHLDAEQAVLDRL